jgi:hypothetical protein
MPPLRRPKEEGRDKKRVTKVLPVDCRVVALPLNQSTQHHLSEGDSFGGRTINLSRTGLQIHSDFELDPKTLVDISLQLGDSGRRITVRVEVAWAKKNAVAIYGRWSMGLRITEAKSADLEALHAYFESLI